MVPTDHELGRIDESASEPKFLQIANRMRELINNGTLGLGDRLPSVNRIIAHFAVSRDTAVKAFQELKQKGIIESTPSKAYFVSNVLIRDELKRILFIADAMNFYKERIYFGLMDSLEPGYYIDFVSHSDNFDILKSLYEKARSSGIYSSILIIPTSAQDRERDYFQFVNPGSILFIDRPVHGVAHPAVWQDFKGGFFEALHQERERLSRYSRLVFLTKFYTNQIIEEMQEGMERYAESVGIPFSRQRTRFTDREIQGAIGPMTGDLFVILDDHLLREMLAECSERSLVPGRDIGIIMINEGPLYEYMSVPISVLSADFYAMGAQAAAFVMTGQAGSKAVATRLITRESI